MTRYGQIGWRMAAVVAFVGTAALAVTLTRAPIRSDAALSSEVTGAACPTSGLEAWLGLARGTYYTLEFTNVSHRACSLYGYPQVSAYTDSQMAGGQIGSAAIRDTSVRPEPVMLAPGATAHSVLRIGVTGGTRASRLRAGDRRGTAGHPAGSGPVRVRSCALPGVLRPGARVAERAGHPGPAGRPRLRHNALT